MSDDRTQPPPGFEWVPENEIVDDEYGTDWQRITESLFDAIYGTVQVFGDRSREWMTPAQAARKHAELLALLTGGGR